jgi:NDP-sugar pyrophosphorylase family protein
VTRLPTVCILAGGRGSRLGDRVASVPKPLLEVAGEPFLLHQLRLLAQNGAEQVVLCVGYLGEQVEARIGSEQFGIRIAYSYDSPDLDGTLGAIRRALPLLPERFLVLYGDTYLPLDYGAAVAAWKDSGLPALMCVFRNDGRWEPSNVIYESGRVLMYDKTASLPAMHWIDYGLSGLEASVLELGGEDIDLARFHRRLAEQRLLFGYEVGERFYEIGTAESLAETDRFLRESRAG